MLCAAGSIVAARMRTTIARLSRRRLLAASAVSIAAVALFRSVHARGHAGPDARASPALAAAPAPEPLAVMSFNIRYGTANDGENHWTKRRDMLFAVMRTENPDLVGLQEALRFQIDEILAAVPGYAVVGVGRDDGKAAGEMSAILFRSDALPRRGERHVLVLRHAGGARLEVVGQPHHAHRIVGPLRRSRRPRVLSLQPAPRSPVAAVAREEHRAAAASASRRARVPAEPVIVTGDFNAGETNPALHVLVGAAGAVPATARRRAVRRHLPRRCIRDEKEVGTFTSFDFGQTTGEKIDYVLVQPGTTCSPRPSSAPPRAGAIPRTTSR